jgi:hypothetical protein
MVKHYFVGDYGVNRNSKCGWSHGLRTFAGWLILAPLLAFNVNAQQTPPETVAAKGYSAQSVRSLIGHQTAGTRYPNGWIYRGGSGFDPGYVEIFVQRGKQHGILIERITEKPIPGQPTKNVVLDAVDVRVDPQDGFKFSDSCKADGIAGDIFAEVRFKRCERYSTRVGRAWLIDRNAWKFVPISAKNVRCEFLFWNQGSEEPNCPTGVDISSGTMPSQK